MRPMWITWLRLAGAGVPLVMLACGFSSHHAQPSVRAPVHVRTIAPTAGAVGTQLVIRGRGFTGATDVTVNGADAAYFVVLSDIKVKAIVPNDATSGPVAVITPQGTATSATPFTVQTNPVQHVVIIFQENHSFDNVLGVFCIQNSRCDGAESGQLSNGTTIPLAQATDIVPIVNHSLSAHREAVDRGRMDGFDRIQGCGAADNYQCYSQFDPSQIPNLAALATTFTVSDRTFEDGSSSFGAHIGLVSPTLDGFSDQPQTGQVPPNPGGGCPSDKDAPWYAPGATKAILVPACIPEQNGSGPYRPSPVPWVPTLMDRMDAAGVSWNIYSNVVNPSGWAICPTFADCIYTSQANQLVPNEQVLSDAAAGNLAQFSIVTPPGEDSQHNSFSMLQGDDWIGQVVSAIEQGPDWGSTAIFITYDDCGCFYDHVPPPTGGVSNYGIRVPMVIVSPYAKPGYTDSTVAGFPSLMAYAEHLFNLQPLGAEDNQAYDFSNAFDYTQTPLNPIPMQNNPIPSAERRSIRQHPGDPNDPT